MKLKIIVKDHLLRKVTVAQGINNTYSPPPPSLSPSPPLPFPLFLLVSLVRGVDDQICTSKTPLGYLAGTWCVWEGTRMDSWSLFQTLLQ